MHLVIHFFTFLTLSVIVKTDNEELKYLGLKRPGSTPEIFAPGLISIEDLYEFGSVFNKEGTAFYYGVNNGGKEEIRYSELVGNKWSNPSVLLKHPRYGYNDPFLSNDESKLFFISQRPLDGNGDPKDYDIWYVNKTVNGWSSPVNAGPTINTSANEYYISFTEDNVMYFSSNKKGNNFDIYTSKMNGESFSEANVLPKEINTPDYEADVFVAPDESYVIFCAIRPEGYGEGDLYISFKDENDEWTSSENMGNKINTSGHELCPFVTKDDQYLFYTSNRDIYWVSTDILESYR